MTESKKPKTGAGEQMVLLYGWKKKKIFFMLALSNHDMYIDS